MVGGWQIAPNSIPFPWAACPCRPRLNYAGLSKEVGVPNDKEPDLPMVTALREWGNLGHFHEPATF